MQQLPEPFVLQTRRLMGEDRFARYLSSFGEEPPVSIRLNPAKAALPTSHLSLITSHFPLLTSPVPWCEWGWYLDRRPNFTFDPLLHAGCYYVQEAASMFLDHALREHLPMQTPLTALDLCAAPGGKSTLVRSLLPPGSVLYSNEPVRQRASILLENVAKWGYADHRVTSLYPRDYRKSGLTFDLILCDVPCSGEGMFRRDAQTIGEWSPQQVERCWRLQRDIVGDAWACLRPGGLMVYSTCTFNTLENEANVQWMLATLAGAEALPVATRQEWGVTGSLLEGFHEPVYRFIPGITRSEGLFVCLLRKQGAAAARPDGSGKTARKARATATDRLPLLTTPYNEAMAVGTVPVDYPTAIAYLRGEALSLSADAPRGLLTVTFLGHALGLVKNIGPRANNLYPKEWRIKSSHVPQQYEPALPVSQEGQE